MRGRRIRFTGKGQVSVESFEVDSPAADEVLIETLYSTISPGTERAHLLAEVNTVPHERGFPFQPGYSNVGRIASVGERVSDFKPGDIVASAMPHVSHGILPVDSRRGSTRRPRFDLAPERSFFHSANLWALDASLPAQRLKECSTHCFSSVALHGVRKARIELGEAVLVLGLGPIGLMACQYARLCGALPVLAIDPILARRRIAEGLGVEGLYADREEFARAHPLVDEGGPAVVIEATGLPQVIPQAFQLCARNGRVILLGSTRGLTDGVNFYTDVHKKGLEVHGVHAGIRPRHESRPGHWTAWDDCAVAFKLIASGRLDCSALITHEFPAARAAEAYELVQRSSQALAVVLDWTG
jgi:2-desacetyl-2-hydroxyethyl bacteriochlorophyllide A dehydrogenase